MAESESAASFRFLGHIPRGKFRDSTDASRFRASKFDFRNGLSSGPMPGTMDNDGDPPPSSSLSYFFPPFPSTLSLVEWPSETNCSSYAMASYSPRRVSSSLYQILEGGYSWLISFREFGDRDLLLRIRGGYRWKRVLLSF